MDNEHNKPYDECVASVMQFSYNISDSETYPQVS